MPSRVDIVVAVLAFYAMPLHLASDEKKRPAVEMEEKTPAMVMAKDGISMRLGLLVQAGLDAFVHRPAGERNTFRLQRARVSLAGHLVSKHFRYEFVGDGAASAGLAAEPPAPGSEMRSASGSVEVPFVLDAFVLFDIPKIRVSFKLGRFIPRWGLLMPEKPSKLGSPLYPLYVHGDIASLGPFRDIGAEAALGLRRNLYLGGGIYNGGVNNWKDENDRKDLSAFITWFPAKGLSFRAASLFKFQDTKDAIDGFGDPIEDGVETHIAPCLEARYQNRGLDLAAGFAMRFAFLDEDDVSEDYRSMGAMAHAGYVFAAQWLELAVQGEYWDPSDDTGGDDRWRITAGPTLRMEDDRLKLGLFYVQDIFAGERAMCQNYLALEECDDPRSIKEARKTASSVFVQMTLDI